MFNLKNHEIKNRETMWRGNNKTYKRNKMTWNERRIDLIIRWVIDVFSKTNSHSFVSVDVTLSEITCNECTKRQVEPQKWRKIQDEQCTRKDLIPLIIDCCYDLVTMLTIIYLISDGSRKSLLEKTSNKFDHRLIINIALI